MNIPVLTYHSMNISGNSYAENDHVALASDLETIKALGFKVIPLNRVVEWHQGGIADEDVSRSVALSFDDGSWFDFYDLDHPTCGMQRSMFNILKGSPQYKSQPGSVHATSFVISSPDARLSLDKSAMIGNGWWDDGWWQQAKASGLMSIECHSWDHVHPELAHVAQQRQLTGDFAHVDSLIDSEIQFARAGEYIGEVLGGMRPTLFAYPYGTVSDYVATQYLPQYQSSHQFKAAFTTEAKAVSKTDSVWKLPRFVCGHDWKSPQELERILNAN